MKRTGDVGPNTYGNSLEWLSGLASKHLESSLDESKTTSVDPAIDAAKRAAETSKLKLDASMGKYERNFAVGNMHPEALFSKQGENPASRTIGMTIDDTVWDTGVKLGSTLRTTGDLPFSANPFIQKAMETGSGFSTIDGVPLDGTRLLRDPSEKIRYVTEKDGKYMYVPALYSTDEFSNTAAEESKFVGSRDRNTGMFTSGKVGDAGERDNAFEQYYTEMMTIIEEDDKTFPEKMLGVGDFDLGDDDLYQTIVKIKVKPNIEDVMREMDGNTQFSMKQLHTPLSDFSGGSDEQELITR